MADLPADRITPSRPFSVTGIDYAGPILVKSGSTRKAQLVKSYFCIFVCFATKAIHLELVTDLTTEKFLNCLKRFISRRGKPHKLYCDNATNFKGGHNQLKELYSYLQTDDDAIQKYLADSQIEWHFIPARAPHFGGLWEAGVKSAKYHLKRVADISPLSFEELYTLLCQIEGCLNSRPLTPLSNDPTDLNPLTPAHFLIGNNLYAIPEVDVRAVPWNRLNQYQRLTQLIQSFWARWRTDYLTELQQRTKWKDEGQETIKPGDLVILKEDNAPPNLWKMGRVVELHPGADGIVRVITLRTSQGQLKRPITKVCLLPSEDEVISPTSTSSSKVLQH